MKPSIYFSRSAVLWLVSASAILAFTPATQAQIIINEIGAFERTDSEWIEIYNTGTDAVDLTDWKFYENQTNHGLSPFHGNALIEPGEYAIIAQKADIFFSEKNFSGTIFDSSWATLREEGEEIGLKDAQGNTIELFTYLPAPNFSLEKIVPNSADYTQANWREHISAHTAGFQNSNFLLPQNSPNETPPSQSSETTEQPAPPATETQETSQPNLYETGDVVINEFVSDPGDEDEEWIELYNKTSRDIQLDGWFIEEGSERKTELSGTIKSRLFFVVEKPKGNLNNSGDLILLKDAEETIIDQIAFGSWQDGDTSDNAPVSEDPYSTARIHDGFDTDRDNADFQNTQTPTKNASNIISQESQKITQQYSADVIINEVYPNPFGADEDEFIELKNTGDTEIFLDGWKLGDATSKAFEIQNITLAPNAIHAFLRKETAIVLNNSGTEEVKLLWPNDEIASLLSYSGPAPEGQSFSRDDKGKWFWSIHVTPRQDNSIEKTNQAPKVVIDGPASAKTGEIITFDGSDSSDPENDAIEFFWEFGDGRTDTRQTAFQVYAAQGEYMVLLTVTDSHGAKATAKHIIEVNSFNSENIVPKQTPSTDKALIWISEFLPNPRGDDALGEFIELYNPQSYSLDLGEWALDDAEGGSKSYQIAEDTFIEANQYITFSREETGIILNNTSDAVRLFDPYGNLVDEARYEKTLEGTSIIREENGGWTMTQSVTPQEINALYAVASQQATAKLKIEDTKELDPGSSIQVEGIVLVEPGILGSQIFYIADESGGIQVYMYKKDWPSFQAGDSIVVSGVTSVSRGEPRVKIQKREDIQVTSTGTPPQPKTVTVAEMENGISATLVSIEGEVTESKGSGFYVDDGTDEMYVYLKKSSGIKKEFRAGDILSVTGIILQTQTGMRLLPRYQSDITIVKVLGEELNDSDTPTSVKTSENSFNGYLIATIVALVIINMHLLLQIRAVRTAVKVKA